MNSIQKKFLRFATLADSLRDQSEEMSEILTRELEKTDGLLNFAELQQKGIKLDQAIAYRDYLWQFRHLIIQVESIPTDGLIENLHTIEVNNDSTDR